MLEGHFAVDSIGSDQGHHYAPDFDHQNPLAGPGGHWNLEPHFGGDKVS